MSSSRKHVLGALTAIASCILMAGCGGSGKTGTSASASGSGSTSGGASGTVLTVAVPSIPTSYDIASSYQGVSSDYAVLSTDDPLVRFKPLPKGSTKLQAPTDIEGELAQSWKRESNGSYEFLLRKAKDPEGHTVTSQDVAWSFQRALAIGGLAQYLATSGHIDAKDPIKVLSARKFILNVTSPSTLTLAVLPALAFGQIVDYSVVKPHITKSDKWATKFLTTHTPEFGPYTLDSSSFSAGNQAELVANPNYWNKGVPYFKKVLLRAVSDPGTRLTLVRTGGVDFATALTYPLLKDIVSSKGSGVYADPTLTANIDMLMFNDKKAPFDNPLVRQALSLGINRASLVQGVYAGFGKPALHDFTSAMPLPPAPKPLYTNFDPTKAKALLKKAGYSHGLAFTLTINPDSGPGPQADSLATALKASLASIGVTANIATVASDSQFADGSSGGPHAFAAFLYQVKPSVVDPAYDAGLVWDPSGLDLSNYTNKAVTPLTEKVNVTAQGATRNKYITRLANLLNQQIPSVPLVETAAPWVLKTGITGAAPNPIGSVYFQDMR